jgi:hypothetical protein
VTLGRIGRVNVVPPMVIEAIVPAGRGDVLVADRRLGEQRLGDVAALAVELVLADRIELERAFGRVAVTT